MNIRKLWYLSGILIILLSVFFFVNWQNEKKTSLKPADLGFRFVYNNFSDIDSVSIKQNDRYVEIVKNEDRFMVDGYEVDKNQLESLKNVFQSTEISGPVSKNKSNHKNFEVDQNGVYVDIKIKDRVLSYVIGKTAFSFTKSYVRKADEDNVYIASSNLRNIFSPDKEAWIDKEIIDLSKLDYNRLEFVSDEFNYTIEKLDEGFKVLQGEKATTTSAGVINSIINNLSPLRSFGFADSKDKENAEDIKSIINVYLGDKSIELVFTKSQDTYLVNKQDTDLTYTIPVYKYNSIFTDIEEVFN